MTAVWVPEPVRDFYKLKRLLVGMLATAVFLTTFTVTRVVMDHYSWYLFYK